MFTVNLSFLRFSCILGCTDGVGGDPQYNPVSEDTSFISCSSARWASGCLCGHAILDLSTPSSSVSDYKGQPLAYWSDSVLCETASHPDDWLQGAIGRFSDFVYECPCTKILVLYLAYTENVEVLKVSEGWSAAAPLPCGCGSALPVSFPA